MVDCLHIGIGFGRDGERALWWVCGLVSLIQQKGSGSGCGVVHAKQKQGQGNKAHKKDQESSVRVLGGASCPNNWHTSL